MLQTTLILLKTATCEETMMISVTADRAFLALSTIIEKDFQPVAGPDNWNDPDMLMLGNFGLSLDEQKPQMAMWAIFAAPFFISTDLWTLSHDSRKILQNKEVIAINQDKLGVQGKMVSSSLSSTHRFSGKKFQLPQDTSFVYSKPLSDGSVAAAFLNTFDYANPLNITAEFTALDVTASNRAWVRDVLEEQHLDVFTNSITLLVNLSGVRLLRLTPVHV